MALVLVVNDDRDMLDLYAAVLEEMGHRPLPRKDLQPDPETVLESGAQALVIDLRADADPLSGLHVIESLRSHPATRDLPVVLCTGEASQATKLRPRLRQLGVPVLTKPFPITAFKEVVGGVLSSE
jgi:CheY-like chemotaxis protein